MLQSTKLIQTQHFDKCKGTLFKIFYLFKKVLRIKTEYQVEMNMQIFKELFRYDLSEYLS